MQQKYFNRTRSWGTRFDPLDPPPSPPSPPLINAAPFIREAAITNTVARVVDIPIKRNEEKMPHDASIFVGSLPLTVEQPELARLLTEHLSDHTEVRNIKVVRDSKGGVCAFVQCEDAFAAASLIRTLHSTPPKPFLGRLLRYEPARAFRTLLISYRVPLQFIPASNNNITEGRSVQLDIPFAMKLWKPANAKFISVVYNGEARSSEVYAQASREHGNLENSGIYLDPVSFDEQTIRKLAEYFGPLEHFGHYKSAISSSLNKHPSASHEWNSYPPPHNSIRTAEMDHGCWEIKWNHRDDCVSALMTLRRVPHLTVTWAHSDQQLVSQSQHIPEPRIAPFSAQDGHRRGSLSISSRTSHTHSRHTTTGSSAERSPTEAKLQLADHDISSTVDTTAPGEDADNDWERKQPQRGPLTQRSPHLAFEKGKKDDPPILQWTDVDFPPLVIVKGERKTDCGVWGERRALKDTADSDPGTPRSSSSPLTPRVTIDQVAQSVSSETMQTVNSTESQELDMPSTPGFGMSPLTPKTPGSLFPETPTSSNNDFQNMPYNGYEMKENHLQLRMGNRGEKELDPTTIFVGGLEMFGPEAWNEERVQNLFAKFGRIEHVKVIRPVNSRSAFAFVKFDNTDSPARAVCEEHNRIYEGRPIRVQLRDCNPPYRGAWRQGRGRGRSQQHGYQRPMPEHSGSNNEAHPADRVFDDDGHNNRVDEFSPTRADGGSASAADPGGNGLEESTNDSIRNTDTTFEDTRGHVADNGRSRSPQSLTEPADGRHSQVPSFEGYREWQNEPLSSIHTPTPSSFGSSASAANVNNVSVGHSWPSVGYYVPQPWMQPFPQPYPYQVPYFAGYPGFPPPPQPLLNTFSGSRGSDASGQSVPPPNPWLPMGGGTYGSYVPYSAFAMRPPADASQPQPHHSGQAPLQPTGFIQNEQGTLIAVYQPEALDQYMSSAQQATPVPQPPDAQTVPTWPQYPPPHAAAYPLAHQVAVLPPRHFPLQSGASMNWIPNPSPLGYSGVQTHQHPQHAPFSAYQHQPQPGTAFRAHGGEFGNTRGQSNPSFRRNYSGNRRDLHGNAHNHDHSNRNNQSRLHTNRYFRGGMQNPANNSHSEQKGGYLPRDSGQPGPPSSGEW